MRPGHLTTFALIIATLLAVLVAAQPAGTSAAEDLDRLVEDYYDSYLELHPLTATQIGDPRFNHLLPDHLSEAGREQLRRLYSNCLVRLQKIDPEALDLDRWLTWQVLQREARLGLQGLSHPGHLLPVSDSFISLPVYFPSLASANGIQPFRTVKDYDDFLARISALPYWVEMAISNLKKGVEQGITQPRSTIERLLPILERQTAGWRSSLLYEPVRRFPVSITRQERKRLTATYKQAINDEAAPAYAKLHRYLATEYLPRCRTSIGLANLPGGQEWYRHHARFYTTTELDPDEILKIGLEELNRVTGEISRLVIRAGHEQHPERFFAQLSQPSQLIGRPDQALEEYREIGRLVEARLAKIMRTLPKTRLAIEAVDRSLAQSSPGAFYQSAGQDSDRPGVFFVNTAGLPFRRFGMMALYLHEAVPGHHLQISLAREQSRLPRYRRFLYQGAFIEGWALYAESLGQELGLYRDPYEEYGRLHMELLRSARLVADVGIHYKGWSRDQVTAVLQDRSLGVGISELDRYIAWPGQALGYKIGELRIRAIRQHTEATLGESFNLAELHDELLRHGALPLDILEVAGNRWLASQQKR
jgi:uncharacterized protein (DUF885 family)